MSGPFWYRGPSFGEAHGIYPAIAFDPMAYSDSFFDFVYDFNGDGFSDVLAVGFPGTDAAWYENPRADLAWPHHKVFDGVDDESPPFVDITGDGVPELVMAHGGQLGWAGPSADPTAPWEFVAATPDLGITAFTHGLGVGDVDGDDRDDLLLATGIFYQGGGSRAASFGAGGAQMYAHDVDGDGDADVITTLAAHEYGLAWFEQRAGDFVAHVILPESPDGEPPIFQPHALALCDIDGDGRLDLITGERFWGHVPPGAMFSDPASLYWFEHASDDRFVAHRIDDASGVGTQVVCVDVDADGRNDLVVANKKGAFVFLQQ